MKMLAVIDLDREHDLAYVSLGSKQHVARSIRASDDVVLDVDEQGKLIGIELMNASTLVGTVHGSSLVGVKEATAILGVQKPNFVRDHANKKDFPPPLVELACGRFWLRSDVLDYARQWKRK